MTRRPLFERIGTELFSPVDVASIVFFRIAFGVLMLVEVVRYFRKGWIDSHFLNPDFHFTYPGFDWVKPWPGNGLYVHMAVLGVLALFIAVGLYYRVSTALFFIGFSYIFLLEQSYYLNHFYLIMLISFLMIFIPAHRAFSLDALLRPGLRSQTVPGWALWLLRFQVGIPYFFGGIAKLDADWLNGTAMGSMLASRINSSKLPYAVTRHFAQPWASFFFAYGGLLFDLLVVPLLLWRCTRGWAYSAAIGFHLTNIHLFHIGIFPWMMMALTTIFFEPDWPRRLLGPPRVTELTVRPQRAVFASGLTGRQKTAVFLLASYMTFHVLFPLRHWFYPGYVSWTEEGHMFSWRMLLRVKNGLVAFRMKDRQTGEEIFIMPEKGLSKPQYHELAQTPDMIIQFAHYLARKMKAAGRDVAVYADCWVSLNGRPYERFIDPAVDLAAVNRFAGGHAAYILPFKQSPADLKKILESRGRRDVPPELEHLQQKPWKDTRWRQGRSGPGVWRGGWR
ncbi:MAG: HTTM domain-containing protein [Candidatus Omnitrophica bacterium]|nr:HTTM domain-containing protein [Candidatus Omnitrophota bacterium]